MSKLDKDAVIAAFTSAYETANGSKPTIEAKGGWYSVDGGKNVRLAQLAEMTDELAGKTSESPAPKANAAPSKKAKSSGSFSVKEFWTDQITAQNKGAILPR